MKGSVNKAGEFVIAPAPVALTIGRITSTKDGACCRKRPPEGPRKAMVNDWFDQDSSMFKQWKPLWSTGGKGRHSTGIDGSASLSPFVHSCKPFKKESREWGRSA